MPLLLDRFSPDDLTASIDPPRRALPYLTFSISRFFTRRRRGWAAGYGYHVAAEPDAHHFAQERPSLCVLGIDSIYWSIARILL